MGYENDLYRDEDGEPLMDYDDEFQSDHGDDNNNQHQNLLDHNLDDELEDNDWQSHRQERSRWDDLDSGSRKRKKFFSGGRSSRKKREKKLSASKFSDRGGRSNEKGESKFKVNSKGGGMMQKLKRCGIQLLVAIQR
ncbi:unnamed protein product [Lactuca saligna]|uniref:Uncharacterized protein n=1 Tax=Lactuca saligna TaxID=75948 RepID=A0AA36E982_LACSI|nr:unnamed protein product [Lactuca saligna]